MTLDVTNDKIDPAKIELTSNYVLVLPDPYFDTYQFGGKETGILTSSYKIDESGNRVTTEHEHIAISGTVYAVPDELKYYGRQVSHVLERNDFFTLHGQKVRNRSDQNEINNYREQSVQFETAVECRVGDKLYWEYLAQMFADQQGLWIDTIHGMMMLIKYDMLILAIRGEEIIPLNGFVIIENDIIEKQKFAVKSNVGNTHVDADFEVDGVITNSGIVLVGTKTDKKTRNTAIATVIHKAGRCYGYLDHRGINDGGFFTYESPHVIGWQSDDLLKGDKILYDPRLAKEVEFGLHRTISEKRLLRIQRKDIFFLLKNYDPEKTYI